MDRVRVSDRLKNNGLHVEIIPDLETCHHFLKSKSGVVVIDLQNDSLDFKKMQDQFSAAGELTRQIVAYFPHVQIHLKKGAEQCGIKHIYPRSLFFNDMTALIQEVLGSGES